MFRIFFSLLWALLAAHNMGCTTTDDREETRIRFLFREIPDPVRVFREVAIVKRPDGKECEIVLHGTIDDELASAYDKASEMVNFLSCPNTIVRLNSNGGNVRLAMVIGRKIRDAGFDTLFDSGPLGAAARCTSACTLVFIGGNRRIVRVSPIEILDGAMGFHRYSSQEGAKLECIDPNKYRSGLEAYGRILLPTNAAEKFVSLSLAERCERVLRVSIADLFDSGIANQRIGAISNQN